MEFKQLKIGTIIAHKKTDVKFEVVAFISENVVEVNNLNYFGMNDYVNTNTVDDYELVTD